MAKKLDPEIEAAPVAATAPVAVAETPRRNGLAIAGIAVGAVIVAGVLFGGGVFVGTHIPDGRSQAQAQFGPGQGGFQGRPDGGFRGGQNGDTRPAPAAPGQGSDN
ncbi:MAG: hypothetical protein KF761_07590 [Salinibacterium sp.]|nr:hypothetical protein [Salinibacterium sp.]